MAEMITFGGETGLSAVIRALENVRRMLKAEDVTSLQASSYLGCINLHLAQLAGLGEDSIEQLESCGGLLCPHCKAYIGFISELSGPCFNCGGTLFWGEEG